MSSKIKKATNGHQHKNQESSSDDDDGPIQAPIQLKIEVRRINRIKSD